MFLPPLYLFSWDVLHFAIFPLLMAPSQKYLLTNEGIGRGGSKFRPAARSGYVYARCSSVYTCIVMYNCSNTHKAISTTYKHTTQRSYIAHVRHATHNISHIFSQKTCIFHTVKPQKTSGRGRCPPNPPPGRCPWAPLGAAPPDPCFSTFGALWAPLRFAPLFHRGTSCASRSVGASRRCSKRRQRTQLL